WNTNIDNAWFWRGPDGNLNCGLMDWGHARQMNVVYALWGCLCGAGLEVWDTRLEEMLALFASQYSASGGPMLCLRELRQHLTVYIAIVGLANLMDVPALVLGRLPEAAGAGSLNDAIFEDHEIVRSFLHILQVFLHFWSANDIAGSVKDIVSG
ncbi:MAG: hypothetical protein KDE55_14715, partial [Novosphingobium sp.]|nr:hypothetical protein [Novosphingobium sp.]